MVGAFTEPLIYENIPNAKKPLTFVKDFLQAAGAGLEPMTLGLLVKNVEIIHLKFKEIL